jgi:YidC/Oxa1 family membrane protein insertase
MKQRLNVILFFVLSASILIGWWLYMQNVVNPSKEKKDGDDEKQVEKKKPPKTLPPAAQVDLYFALSGVAAPEPAGMVNAVRLAQRIAAADQVRNERYWRQVAARKIEDPRPALEAFLGLAPFTLNADLAMRAGLLLRQAKDAKSPEEAHPLKTFVLGKDDPKYYLHATITTKGGGVQKLVLPQFDAADEEGRPALDSYGNRKPLELIRDDPFVASYLMYHYADPNDDKSAKLLLGEANWKVEEVALKSGAQRVVLSFDRIPKYAKGEVVKDDRKQVVYEKLKIVKTFTLEPNEYHLSLTIEIIDGRTPEDEDRTAKVFKYQLAGSHGTPVEGIWYANPYRTPLIGKVDANNYLSRDLDETQARIANRKGGEPVMPGAGSWLQYAGVSNQYFATVIAVDDQQADRSIGGVDKKNVVSYARPTLESEEVKCRIVAIDLDKKTLEVKILDTNPLLSWMGTAQIFHLLPHTVEQVKHHKLTTGDDVFVAFYNPKTDRISSIQGQVPKELVATEVRKGNAPRPQIEDITVRVVSNPDPGLTPGSRIIHKYVLYNGPAKVRLLSDFTGDKAVDPKLVTRYADTLHLATITDYRSPGIFGEISSRIFWTNILIWCTQLMHGLLNLLHHVVPNYGLAIIALTFLVRGLMFPISRRQAMLSIRMQEMAPEIKKVQEKYKDDPTKRNQEVMALYRKYGVNPLGSCLPLLLQLPFFLGLYYALQESVHFRLAGFLWIQNLAAPDMLLWWGTWIPFLSDPDHYGNFYYLGPYLNVLPIIAVVLMLVQQKLMTPPPADEQQEMQQKMMKYMMVVIGIMFYKVAAGLCIYFITSSLWGLAERKLLPKKKPAPAGTGPAPDPGGGGSSGGGGGGPGGGGKPGGGRKGPGGRGKQRPAKKEKGPDTTMDKMKNWWQEVLKQAKKK